MLSKIECLKILELAPGADQYEIENRYTMLIKRYRGHNDAESVARLEEISLAYNILTGRYIEPEPENPRLENVVMGRSVRQWKNIWHYGRLTLLAGLLGLALLIYFIYTIATNKPADFQIAAVGVFSQTEEADSNVDSYIKGMFPAFDEVEYLFLPMDLSSIDGPTTTSSGETSGAVNPGGNYLYESIMKMMTMMVGDTYEIYVCDDLVFSRYAPQGAFADLTAFYADLQQSLPASLLAKVKPLYAIPLDSSEETDETAALPEVNQDTPGAVICGLDVSELDLTEGLGIYGDAEILTIGVKADATTEAADFLKNWIMDFEEMNTRQSEFEASQSTTAD